ncbi:MAG: hypothetical protein ACKOK8_15440, partial [Planctomycetia bacterium]
KSSWASSSDSMMERVSGVVTSAAGGCRRRRRDKSPPEAGALADLVRLIDGGTIDAAARETTA